MTDRNEYCLSVLNDDATEEVSKASYDLTRRGTIMQRTIANKGWTTSASIETNMHLAEMPSVSATRSYTGLDASARCGTPCVATGRAHYHLN